MRALDLLRDRFGGESRHSVVTVDDYVQFLGHQYPLGLNTSMPSQKTEAPPNNFDQYAMQLFSANPTVYAAVMTRMAVFSQIRLAYRRFEQGRPQAPFGDKSLERFEKPWPGGTTLDLLSKMLVYADLGGQAFVWSDGRQMHVWRPDYVTIVMGSMKRPDSAGVAEDAVPIGYIYSPTGRAEDAREYMPSEVAHFAPYPDPLTKFRGMSWLTPIVREVLSDKAAVEHKWKFFTNAATPNLAIKFDAEISEEKIRAFKRIIDEDHEGTHNAYKTLYLGGGADPTVIGADMQQLDFTSLQGKAETRIAMAAGVHPVILGASEGMQGSSLNAGNYAQVRRLFADVRMQHLWRNAVSSLSVIATPPNGAELWFDTRDMPFLQQDGKDRAEIQSSEASAITALVRDGFTPESVVAAIRADDWSLLKHTNLLSVQLLPPGSDGQTSTPSNGEE